jgi:hypothetical protein
MLHQQRVGSSHAFPKTREPHNSLLPTCHKPDSGTGISIETQVRVLSSTLGKDTVIGWEHEVAQAVDCKEALPGNSHHYMTGSFQRNRRTSFGMILLCCCDTINASSDGSHSCGRSPKLERLSRKTGCDDVLSNNRESVEEVSADRLDGSLALLSSVINLI